MTFPPDPQKRPEAAAVLKKFEARKFKPEAYTLYSYAAVQIMAEGAKRANSTDPKKIAAALQGRHHPSGLHRLHLEEGRRRQDNLRRELISAANRS